MVIPNLLFLNEFIQINTAGFLVLWTIEAANVVVYASVLKNFMYSPIPLFGT